MKKNKEEFQIGDWVQWNTKKFGKPHSLIEAGRPYLIVDTEGRHIGIRHDRGIDHWNSDVWVRAAASNYAATGHVDMDLDEIHRAQELMK